MNKKKKTEKNESTYLSSDLSSSAINEPQAEYITRTNSDLFDESGTRKFYSLEEFEKKLADSFNARLGTNIKL